MPKTPTLVAVRTCLHCNQPIPRRQDPPSVYKKRRYCSRDCWKQRGPQQTTIDLCRNGHPYTPENTYMHPTAGRKCRTCARQWKRNRTREERATNPPRRPDQPTIPDHIHAEIHRELTIYGGDLWEKLTRLHIPPTAHLTWAERNNLTSYTTTVRQAIAYLNRSTP